MHRILVLEKDDPQTAAKSKQVADADIVFGYSKDKSEVHVIKDRDNCSHKTMDVDTFWEDLRNTVERNTVEV